MPHRLLAALLLVSIAWAASAGMVGVVVQYDGTTVATDCVAFTGNPSAYEILASSRFSAATEDFPPFGPGLCGIDGVGCAAGNCFCSSKYWGFYYLQGGGWQYSNVGIGFAQDGGYQIVQDGGVIGFRWGDWGEMPAVRQFGGICARAEAAHSAKQPSRLVLSMDVGCMGKETLFVVADGEGRAMPFAEVNVLEYTPLMRVERVGWVVVDADGKGSIGLDGRGPYYFEAMLPQYAPDRKEVYVDECVVAPVVKDDAAAGQADIAVAATQPIVVMPPVNAGSVAGELGNWVETGWNASGWMFSWRAR